MSKAEQIYQTQSEPKHCKKSSDLRCCLKAVSDVDELMLDSRLFHAHETATRKARVPMVEWNIAGTMPTSDAVASI